MKGTVTASAAANASRTLCFLFACGLLIHSDAADQLRPSDHGLENQLTPSAGETSSPAMMSFFGASALESPPLPSPASINYSADDGSWLRGSKKNRVREILLMASLAFGVSGVALLLASAMLFLFRLRKGRRSASTVNDSPTLPAPEINNSK